MGEGLFSFWHIAILLFVIFIVMGPKAIVKSVRGAGDSIQQLVNGGASTAATAEPARAKRKKGFAYRVGRVFGRGKRKR